MAVKLALQYPGSKGRIVKNILPLIPPHHSYVEPYFGSGTNDLDSDVVNLFKCIAKDSNKLAKLVANTPYSREIYESSYDKSQLNKEVDEFEQALCFLIRCWQSHGFRNNGIKVGWKMDVIGRERMYALKNWVELPERVLHTAERLRNVQIEHSPAVEVIKNFNHEDVFMYIDPPYLLDTRSGKKQYKHEMTKQDHIDLLQLLKNSKAKIMISGYNSDLYNVMLKGWIKKEFRSNAQNGQTRIEVIWMNYETQISLFSV